LGGVRGSWGGGLVPRERWGGGGELEEEHHRLRVGKTGRSYGVGDELRVRVVASDPVRRRISLEPASLPRSGPWLTEEDLTPRAKQPKQKQKPRRPGPKEERRPEHPRRRESSPVRPSPRRRRRASGR